MPGSIVPEAKSILSDAQRHFLTFPREKATSRECAVDLPKQWIIVVSVSDSDGQLVISKAHECRDKLHASALFADIRTLVEDFGLPLPSLLVEIYELRKASHVTPDG